MIAFGQYGSPETSWLTAVNVGLGIVVLIGVLAAMAGVVQEAISGRRRRRELSRELDRDLRKLVAEFEGREPKPDLNTEN